jgi:hypothetical protein
MVWAPSEAIPTDAGGTVKGDGATRVEPSPFLFQPIGGFMAEIAQQNDIYQLRVKGQIDAQETNNVLHFRCASGAGDDDVLTHLVLVLMNCFVTHLIPVLPQNAFLNSIIWKKVSPALGPETETPFTPSQQGAGDDQALPSFCSAVFSIRTAVGGRSHRGRMYLAGIPESQTTQSSLTSGDPYYTALLAFAACVVASFIPGDPVGTHSWAMGVYSRKIGGSHFPYGGNGFTPMTSFVPHTEIGTTRSRKVGRGS